MTAADEELAGYDNGRADIETRLTLLPWMVATGSVEGALSLAVRGVGLLGVVRG